MGHANLDNLSKIFARQLYAHGTITIKQVVDRCIEIGEPLKASEGEYEGEEGRPIIAMGVEEVANYLKHDHAPLNTPVIETVDMTEEQQKIFDQWCTDDMTEWDCGDDGSGGEYGILDSIKWRFASGWRKQYPNIPVLGHVTN